MPHNNPELRKKIQQLWGHLWSGGISNPLAGIEQITYLLFMRQLEEFDLVRQAVARSAGEPYCSLFEGVWLPPEQHNQPLAAQRPLEKRALRWSEFKRLPADEMLWRVQTQVFPFMKQLGVQSRFTLHMTNSVMIISKPSLLAAAVTLIDEIFEGLDRNCQRTGRPFHSLQGEVYELLLAELSDAGRNGQFRTPRHIIKLMADLVRPQLGERIVDPACGTGGTLVGAYQYLVTQGALSVGAEDLPRDEDGFVRTASAAPTAAAQSALADTLWGYDIEAAMVRLAIMNLTMHGIAEPHINLSDTLGKEFMPPFEYDIVLANPPFSGNMNKADLNDCLRLSTTQTELLFVENSYRLLKKGGRACVIVPQGVLFDSGAAFKAVRQTLVDRCELMAVITLPSGVFKPYAGIATALLLFTKVWGPEDEVLTPATQQVFFYGMESDGYSLDDKRTKQEGYGDLQDILEKYHDSVGSALCDRSSKCFRVPRAEIESEGYDLSFTRYKHTREEGLRFDPPSLILDRIIEAEVGATDLDSLSSVDSGIVGELLKLKKLLG